MSLGYRLYEPLFVLKPIVRDVWIADGGEIRMRLGPLRMPFPTRMIVVRLPDGGLWLHSPIALQPKLVAQIGELGPVTDIVAPSNLHYTWTSIWSHAFGNARLWTAPGMTQQVLARLPAHRRLSDDAPPHEWQGAFKQQRISGGPVTEVDFFHEPSRILMLTDAIENLDLKRFKSIFYRLVTWAAGSNDPDGMLPWELRRHFRANRQHNRVAIDRMIAWRPDRILLAHGRCYERDGWQELKRAFRWL
ncbi:DUF4336 domain-containing protein [Mesorhizobium sp. B283B1A]|uniref:DUF4336 domain-containing protein n=1 Tax=Mesorhizobium TaxID=68287 RepID=UPI001CD0D24E|nr:MULTISPECIES: DUF4336 domain-containing protein [Mesorhizobium]MCA0046231.1 DUF4336 domain-containing protein [Mesorhizobium sp. B283B1A]UQS62847.1 DUF4336 domain-containing protein [Mesorhizobium opportunistum]